MDRVSEVDFGENLTYTQQVLKVNGTNAAYASSRVREPVFPHYPLMSINTNIRLIMVYSMPDGAKRQACGDIVQAIEDGKLIHAVGARFPLGETAAAHELIESGDFIGNVVVEID